MARTHKSRSMSLVSAKALAKAFNGTRFLISGDRHDKRAWNASRNEVRASIPACYHDVFDAGCPAFGAGLPVAKYPQSEAAALPVVGTVQAAPFRTAEQRARTHGADAARAGKAHQECPYGTDSLRREWLVGFSEVSPASEAARIANGPGCSW